MFTFIIRRSAQKSKKNMRGPLWWRHKKTVLPESTVLPIVHQICVLYLLGEHPVRFEN